MRVEGHKQSLDRALLRSRQTIGTLETIFENAGLPPELARLAIVESLFRANAVSRSGAVGAYQFVASTGREYLMIRRGIDERRDPLRAAWAAARYLKKLHKRFGRLDLALTAYNVGPTRLARMIRQQKTQSLPRLIRTSKDEGFGFDGQNYFAQIAAVLELSAGEEDRRRPEEQTATFRLARPMRLSRVAACLDLLPVEVAARNPAFSRAIRTKNARIPQAYLVGAPRSVAENPIVAEVHKKTDYTVE
jgi:membrane-bound lytic murein transglycosylase D